MRRVLNGKIKPFLANSLWLLFCYKKHLAFQRAIKNVEKTQRMVLANIMEKNKNTEYGRLYGFKEITDIDRYRVNVPLTTYESYQGYINSIADGQMSVLTSERVTMLAPTSGSTVTSKHIPYTAGLKEEFQKGIAPWIFDLFTHRKKILSGRAYWSVTPVNMQQFKTTGGIPVGFEEDTEYFGFVERYFLRVLLTVPKEVALIQDIDAFRYVTLLFLLREKYLTFISVWNPSFLTLLLKPL
ncbi:MAG: GH3 family domain-containing protein [Bacillota bacterium]